MNARVLEFVFIVLFNEILIKMRLKLDYFDLVDFSKNISFPN